MFTTLTWLIAIVLLIAYGYYQLRQRRGLKGKKIKETGDGQHGSARWGTREELEETFKCIEYRPDLWRHGENLPKAQGIIIHCEDAGILADKGGILGKISGISSHIPGGSSEKSTGNTPLKCYVDDDDVHMLLIGAAGVGKTANFLYPNIEYAFASGMSFFTTDTKGDLYRNTGTIGEKYYGYEIKVIDLRNPLESSGYNMIYLINKYMDKYKETKELKYLAKAEKYAKITSKTIIEMGVEPGAFGQNSYFYDAAEGIVTATLLIVAEYGGKGERHIVSVFKLIQDLMSTTESGMTQFQVLMEFLPQDSRAKFYASSALKSSEESMNSVMSTAMSRLLTFIDAELEQIMCFKNGIDIERFCRKKTAIYLVLPEEDTTKYFIAGLFIQQMYRELLVIADSKGGKLDNRVMFYCDEIGTMPKIDGLESMFSAARSRKISIVAIIQSLSQFEQKYGKEGSEIIQDNCQITLFGGFAPNSSTAEVLSKNLGNQTIESESLTYGANINPLQAAQSRQVSMMQRQLMTTDELKNMPKGCFILMKTGCHPFKTRLKLFLKWGIKFEDLYQIAVRAQKKPRYADKNDICDAVIDSNEAIGETVAAG